MVDLDLEREMRRVLLDLEMTSCGVTASLDSNGSGAFGSAPPRSGDFDPPHLRYRREWNAARGGTERQRILERARDELDSIRVSRAGEGSETEAERTRRMLREGEGFTAREVAVRFATTEAAVRRTRSRHGRSPENGTVEPMRPMPDATPAERRERVALLWREHRMSTRRIALVLGVSHETVRRDMMWRGEGRKAA